MFLRCRGFNSHSDDLVLQKYSNINTDGLIQIPFCFLFLISLNLSGHTFMSEQCMDLFFLSSFGWRWKPMKNLVVSVTRPKRAANATTIKRPQDICKHHHNVGRSAFIKTTQSNILVIYMHQYVQNHRHLTKRCIYFVTFAAIYYRNVTASWRLTLLPNQLFVQQLVHTHNKKTPCIIKKKLFIIVSFWGESTGNWWIPQKLFSYHDVVMSLFDSWHSLLQKIVTSNGLSLCQPSTYQLTITQSRWQFSNLQTRSLEVGPFFYEVKCQVVVKLRTDHRGSVSCTLRFKLTSLWWIPKSSHNSWWEVKSWELVEGNSKFLFLFSHLWLLCRRTWRTLQSCGSA